MMIKSITFAAAAATAVALSAPVLAAPVSATTDANAKVRIVRPIQLTSTQDLDLGTIVLSGTAPYSSTVKLDKTGSLDCDGGSGDVVCQGTTQVATYNVSGTKSQPVTISVPDVTLLDGAGNSLTLTADYDNTLTLSNSGSPGDDFNVGGSVTVTDGTVEGVYSADFAVTADYQ